MTGEEWQLAQNDADEAAARAEARFRSIAGRWLLVALAAGLVAVWWLQ